MGEAISYKAPGGSSHCRTELWEGASSWTWLSRGESVLGVFILTFLFYRRQAFGKVLELGCYLRHGVCTCRHKDLQEDGQNLEVQHLGWRSNSLHHCSVTRSCPTLCNPMPAFPTLHYLPEFTQTHVHWVGDAIQPSHPLSSSSPAFSLSSIRVFPHESALGIRWPKYWSFSISPSNEYSGLISFRIDWFDLHYLSLIRPW